MACREHRHTWLEVEPQSHCSPYSTMPLPQIDTPDVKQKPPAPDVPGMVCGKSDDQ